MGFITDAPLVFFGSGPVASESLRRLAKNFLIEAVVTKPKPDHHRGSFPVIDTAKELGLQIYNVSNKKELDNLIGTTPFQSKIGVIIDFGIIVSQKVIDYFPLGIVNSHFSLLPELRGADPITFSILSGQTKTGVSLMLIEPTLDTGKLITHKSLNIGSNETTPSLTDRLIELSDELLTSHLPAYIKGDTKPRQQPHPDRATYSRKLTKEDGVIDWTKPAEQIEREIRAFAGWPNSRTVLAGKEVIIIEAVVIDLSGKPGDAFAENKQLVVYCGEKALLIKRLKPAGKKEMTGEAFIAGHKNLL